MRPTQSRLHVLVQDLSGIALGIDALLEELDEAV